jgi:hypothetical protein
MSKNAITFEIWLHKEFWLLGSKEDYSMGYWSILAALA